MKVLFYVILILSVCPRLSHADDINAHFHDNILGQDRQSYMTLPAKGNFQLKEEWFTIHSLGSVCSFDLKKGVSVGKPIKTSKITALDSSTFHSVELLPGRNLQEQVKRLLEKNHLTFVEDEKCLAKERGDDKSSLPNEKCLVLKNPPAWLTKKYGNMNEYFLYFSGDQLNYTDNVLRITNAYDELSGLSAQIQTLLNANTKVDSEYTIRAYFKEGGPVEAMYCNVSGSQPKNIEEAGRILARSGIILRSADAKDILADALKNGAPVNPPTGVNNGSITVKPEPARNVLGPNGRSAATNVVGDPH